MWITVPAPLGFPPVFYLENSVAGLQLRDFVLDRGYTEGYAWDYDEKDDSSKSNDRVNSGHLIKHVLIVAGIAIGLALTFVAVKFTEKYKQSQELSPHRYTKLNA